MAIYPLSISNLIKNLSKLPGVGEKSAERMAMHILRAPLKQAQGLAQSILELKEKVKLCTQCFAFTDTEVCSICSDPSRESSLVCVVEQPADMVAIEKSGSYSGLYHILEGLLSPMNGIGPDQLRIRELFQRIEAHKVREIVLATSTSVEGEATASYLAEQLKRYSVNVTRIATGVPMGGELKYIDPVTLKRAMETRRSQG